MSPEDQAILDLCGDVARILQGQNLVIATPTPTRRDSANLCKKTIKPNRWVKSQIDDAKQDANRNRMVSPEPGGNTFKPYNEDHMATATKPNHLSGITLPVQPYVAEYMGNHLQLRRNGISLADYCQSAMRDNEPNYTLSSDLRDVLDLVQSKHCGGVADPSRPLDAVV